MESIILYTTHCPKCKILEKKLQDKKISYSVCEDVNEMKEKGVTSVPVLSIDGKQLSFYEAVKFANEK